MGEEAVKKIERQKTKKEIFVLYAKKCTTLHMCPQGSATGNGRRTSTQDKRASIQGKRGAERVTKQSPVTLIIKVMTHAKST